MRGRVEREARASDGGEVGISSDSPIVNIAGWSKVSLAEITIKIGSGATPRGGSETYLDSRIEYALIRSQNVFDRRFDRDGLAYITNEQANELRGVILQRSDVLLNITGDGVTFGRSCIVPEDIRPACVNQHVSIIRVDSSKADAGYVLSFLTHPDVKLYIETFNAGGSRRAITKRHIESFCLPLPPLPVQRAIARILGALDDKIELNRKMNATLEAMARALFKSWFVDFDPVRAKAEGRAPSGMDAETARLFPSEFVDSELGRIPKGWRVGAIGDVASNRRNTVHPTEVLSSSVYLGLEHLARGRIFFHDVGRPENLESLKTRFSKNEVLFGKLRPYFKKVAIAPCDGICSTDILVLSPRPGAYGFVTLLAASDMFIEHAVAFSDGTRMPRTSWEQLKRYFVVIPDDDILAVFDIRCLPLFARAEAARQESLSLARLRDALLPRLLSGELSVAHAEREAGRVNGVVYPDSRNL